MDKEQIVNELFAAYVNTLEDFAAEATSFINEDLQNTEKKARIKSRIETIISDVDRSILDIDNKVKHHKTKFAENLASLQVIHGASSILMQSMMLVNEKAVLKSIKSVFENALTKLNT